VSAYHGPGLDVCPPVQEDLHGPEVAFLRSIVEGSPSMILSEYRETTPNTDRWNTNTIHTFLHTYIHTYIYVPIHYTAFKNYKI
jgi:hypothetical protein